MILNALQSAAAALFKSPATPATPEAPAPAAPPQLPSLAGALFENSFFDKTNPPITIGQVLPSLVHQKSAALQAEGQKALKEGRYADAKKAFEELKKQPTHPMDQADHLSDEVTKGGNTTRVKKSGFQETTVTAADRGLAQAAQLERMEKTLGRKVDPHNVEDAKAYFQKFSQGKNTDEVRKEFDSYLKNFYAHSGNGVDWNAAVPEKDRPARFGELLANQPTDKSGRKLVDCEGYCYLTGAILGGVKGADGKPRFDVRYVQQPGHIIAAVRDRAPKGQSFTVNNDTTELWPVPFPSTQVWELALKAKWNQTVTVDPVTNQKSD